MEVFTKEGTHFLDLCYGQCNWLSCHGGTEEQPKLGAKTYTLVDPYGNVTFSGKR